MKQKINCVEINHVSNQFIKSLRRRRKKNPQLHNSRFENKK